MATVKHLAIKNKSYAFSLKYLTYQFDEKTNQPILDENMHMVEREEYLIDAIGVASPLSFADECQAWNDICGKNQSAEEVKLHHYIISFDPKDVDQGLTLEKVQAIGMEIANKYFAGCQALVCSHPDGHNKSGNMHVHIVVNSIRKEAIEKPDFIERKSECIAGAKIRASKIFMNSIKQEVMDITQRENLNQVNLLTPAKDKITEREYRKQRREQDKLDAQNAELEKEGFVPAKVKFETEKAILRKIIKRAMLRASDEAELRKFLQDEGIEITESRGRWGFKSDQYEKTIRARQLGTAYEKEYILNQFGTTGKIQDSHRYNGKLKRMINVQNAINAADTMKFFVENRNTTAADLLEKKKTAKEKYAQLQQDKKPIWEKLNHINPIIHHIGSFYANKEYYNAWKQMSPKQRESYEIQYSAQLAAYKKSDEFLSALMKEQGLESYPSYEMFNALKAQKNELMDKLERIESESARTLETIDELDALITNYSKMLDQEIEPEKEQQAQESARDNEAR